jgi:outer membrane receptor for ferrienterochelin and colicin
MSGLFTLRSDNSKLALRAAHFRRETPRGSNGSLYEYEMETLKPSYTENDFFVDYQYQWNLGKNKITLNPSVHFFSYYEQSFLTWGVNRAGNNGTRSGTLGEYNNYQAKLTYERQVAESLNVIAGLDGLLARFSRSDAVSTSGANVLLRPSGYTEPGNWMLGGAFAQMVFTPVKQVDLTLGARYDTFQNEADPRLTPRMGLVVKPMADAAIKFLYGQSYLAPMWAHTRANDGNFFVDPNLKLQPETFTGYDLIFSYGNKKASVTADLYYNEVRGLINGVAWNAAEHPDEQAPCVNGTNCIQYRNSADSLYLGGELSAAGQVLPWLRLEGSYSYIRPDTDTRMTTKSLLVGSQIAHIPAHTVRYGLRLDPLANLSVLVWGRTYFRTSTIDFRGADYNTLPTVALFDASVNYSWNRFAFQLLGKNLSDRYYELGGTVARPLARERLSIEGSVAVKF